MYFIPHSSYVFKDHVHQHTPNYCNYSIMFYTFIISMIMNRYTIEV